MKKTISLVLALVIILSTFVACAPAAAPPAADGAAPGAAPEAADGLQPRSWRLGHNSSDWGTWNQGALRFAALLYEYSGGMMVLDVFPNAQLGDELEMVRSVQDGVIDFVIAGGHLVGFAPKAILADAPYLYADFDHLREVFDGPLGEIIHQNVIDYAFVRPIMYFIRGPRKLTANRPIHTPDDMSGLVIRVPPAYVVVATFEALGATVVPMALGEVFTALQQGVLDAQENPLAMIDAQSFYEVQPYIMNTNHTVSLIWVTIGEELYQSLSPQEREIIHRAAAGAQAYEHELFLEEEYRLYALMEERGVTFIDVDFELFRDTAMDAIIESFDPEVRELFLEIANLR